jgi:hypothetical protein
MNRIQLAQQEDDDRLLRVVREIAPLLPEETNDGTQGEWRKELPRDDDPETWDYGFGETPGILVVNENVAQTALTGLLAHELRHVCTVQEDLKKRGPIEDEWASELTADWYAVVRWSFRAEVEAIRANSDLLHHGPSIGERVSTEVGVFWIDDNFVAHRVEDDSS